MKQLSREELLISECSRMVAWEARSALNARNLPSLEFNDLVQEGYLAVLKAARRYDPGKGAKFTTYAQIWVRNKIKDAAFQDNSVRLPLNALRKENRNFYEPYFQQLASFRSLDALLGEGTATLHDFLGKADPTKSDRADSQGGDYLEKVASTVLTDREKEVLGRRFAIFGYEVEENQKEVAKAMRMGFSTVPKVEKRALYKMRRALCGGEIFV